MVQRSPTIVVRSETMSEMFWSSLYSEEAVAIGMDTETADLIGSSTPFKLAPARLRLVTAKIRERDAEMYAGLEAAWTCRGLVDTSDRATML